MRANDTKSERFDLPRKDHAGRPLMIASALLVSSGVWALVILALTKLF